MSLSTHSFGMDSIFRILLLCLNVWLSQAAHCTFPPEWQGTWYQFWVAAQGELQISKHSISQRGHCVKNEGHKFLLIDREKMCFVCLVFTPQHKNLLQFKESYCIREDKLEDVCGRITGDFVLHTIVKVPSVPVPCPFKGPYWFSYNNQTNRDCDEPYSEIQECADRSKFIFKYKRCQDIQGSRDQDLQFQCLATWFNGEKFLYGKFTGPGLTEKNQMYRCFMHSFWGTQGEMAMSADPTCQGLQSPRVGYLTMALSHRTDKWSLASCTYPEFFTDWKEWRDIGGEFRISMDPNNQEFRIFNVRDRRGDRTALLAVRCMDMVEKTSALTDNTATWSSGTHVMKFVTFTNNDSCVSMYQCMRLKKRGPAVVELMLGTPVSAQDRACEDWSFDNVHKYVLIPTEARISPCPFPGSYDYVDKMSNCRGQIEIGCDDPTLMVIKALCPQGLQAGEDIAQGSRTTLPPKSMFEILQCNQNWTDGDTRSLYIVVSKPGDTQRVSDCLIYKESIDGFELIAEDECGGGNLRILNKPISVIIQPSRQACKAPEPRVRPQPSTNPHTRKDGDKPPSHDVRGGRDNRGYSDRNNDNRQNPQIDKKVIDVINASYRRTYTAQLLAVCVLVTLLASLR